MRMVFLFLSTEGMMWDRKLREREATVRVWICAVPPFMTACQASPHNSHLDARDGERDRRSHVGNCDPAAAPCPWRNLEQGGQRTPLHTDRRHVGKASAPIPPVSYMLISLQACMVKFIMASMQCLILCCFACSHCRYDEDCCAHRHRYAYWTSYCVVSGTASIYASNILR